MSLFIRLDSGFWTHRKTMRLRASIGDAALWVPPRLWNYAAQNQPDGNFSDYTATELAMLLGYQADAQALLQALQQVGFMDGMQIHDWHEHNGYHATFAARAKKAAAARWKKTTRGQEKTVQDKRGEDASIATSIATSIPTEKKPSRGQGTREDVFSFFCELKLPDFDAEWFFEKCVGNGWTNGGKPIKDWKATVRSWRAARYLPSQKQNGTAYSRPVNTAPLQTRSNPGL